METTTIKTEVHKPSYQFSEEEVPKEILGVQIPIEDIDRLRMGEHSSLLENVITDDKYTVKDAKIKLTRNKEGKCEVNFIFKENNLTIPDEILGNKLTDIQKKELKENKTVGPLKINNLELYLRVDPELNRVIVSTDKELSIPSEIGKYKLSEPEKNDLANNRQLNMKVLEGEHGFFLAKVSITLDKKGLVFSDVKEITQSEAMRLKTELNTDNRTIEKGVTSTEQQEQQQNVINDSNKVAETNKGAVVDNVVNVTKPLIELTPQQKLINDRNAFTNAYENNNLAALNELKKKGFEPSEQDMIKLNNCKTLTYDQKVIAASIYDKEDTIIGLKQNETKKAEVKPELSNVVEVGANVMPTLGKTTAKTEKNPPTIQGSGNEENPQKKNDKEKFIKEGLNTFLSQ